MKVDIQNVLAYEIKKEIAERYFGFRKLIEDDNLQLEEKLRQYSFILEKRISFDLLRIYLTIHDPQLINAFLELIGLESDLYYDSYLSESETIKHRVFEGVRLRGMTWSGRYKNLIIDCYERLSIHVDQYREKFKELMDLHDTITEEIRIFNKQNDLGSILGFLRSLGDNSLSGQMQGGMEPGIAGALEKKMAFKRVSPPDHPPVLNQLPAISTIKSPLQKIIAKAYDAQEENFKNFFGKQAEKSPWERIFS